MFFWKRLGEREPPVAKKKKALNCGCSGLSQGGGSATCEEAEHQGTGRIILHFVMQECNKFITHMHQHTALRASLRPQPETTVPS